MRMFLYWSTALAIFYIFSHFIDFWLIKKNFPIYTLYTSLAIIVKFKRATFPRLRTIFLLILHFVKNQADWFVSMRFSIFQISRETDGTIDDRPAAVHFPCNHDRSRCINGHPLFFFLSFILGLKFRLRSWTSSRYDTEADKFQLKATRLPARRLYISGCATDTFSTPG